MKRFQLSRFCGDIEKIIKEEIRQAIIALYNFDMVTGRYVDEELQKEKMIKEIAGKLEGKYNEETIREAMNKAHQHDNKPIEMSEGEMNETETMNNNPDEQAIIDYNAMEEEWEMDNYNEMQNGTK